MEKIRLDKYLSSQMNISRSDAKRLIREKSVAVNGIFAAKSDMTVSGGEDEVTVQGRRIGFRKFLYIMQNKPEGVVSASVGRGDVTVVDILPDELRRAGLFPAGRLDKDTTGFVLITDDGEFAHGILSPSRHVPKTYLVTLRKNLTASDIGVIEGGMTVSGELFKPACVEYLSDDTESGLPVYKVIITEGKYHQIKRMFASLDNKVMVLKRIAIGGLALDETLKEGESREITQSELDCITSK